jgi:hypothetical protein
MPLAPMGCAVQIYKSSERRGTWAEHTTDGWYLETSHEHYRCHKVHVKRTNSEIITDTVFFKHRYITQPSVTSADILTKAIDDLAAVLKQQRNTEGIKEMEALWKLDELLNRKAPETTNVPNPTVERPSTKNARCVMMDIKYFYLNTPMERYEYMKLKLSDIPSEIQREYKIQELTSSDEYV